MAILISIGWSLDWLYDLIVLVFDDFDNNFVLSFYSM